MIGSIRRWILALVVTSLQVGAHCGLCGAWMEHEIIYRSWPWSVCAKCTAPNKREVGDE